MQKDKVVLTALAALNLVLVLANILLTVGNQSLQSEVSERQQLRKNALQRDLLGIARDGSLEQLWDRSPSQARLRGGEGLSHHRGMVGGKLGRLLNQ